MVVVIEADEGEDFEAAEAVVSEAEEVSSRAMDHQIRS